MPFSLNRETLIPQILSVLQYMHGIPFSVLFFLVVNIASLEKDPEKEIIFCGAIGHF